MEFQYAEEHLELRDSVRRFLADVASEEATRKAMDTETGWDPAVYGRLAGELGLVGLAVPEQFGGSGYGILELGVVLQEAGRALLCAPLLAVSVAARALLESGDEAACARYLPDLAAGDLIASLAVLEPGGWDAPLATQATPVADATNPADAWTLTGAKEWALDAPSAALLLVSAQAPEGPTLFLVDPEAAGVTVEPINGVDPTRRQGRVRLQDAAAIPLGTVGGAAPVLERVLDTAVVLLAAEQVGVAERCLAMATGYAKEREQFDRPIGSFQAIKHKLADVLLEIEAATSAVMFAMWTADEAPQELPQVAAIAGSTCSEAALLSAAENIQIHGGMGVTWEHPAHLYLKRATTSRQLFGDPQRHLERLARTLNLTG